jgi:hypothetical protein
MAGYFIISKNLFCAMFIFYPRIEVFEICILLELGKRELKKHLHYFNIFILDGWEVTTIIVFFVTN